MEPEENFSSLPKWEFLEKGINYTSSFAAGH
jgi:hypothetical protein